MKKECLCPLCGKNNLCQVNSADCWCKDVVVSDRLVSLIPSNKQGKSCICRQCIDSYNKGPEEFLAGIKNK